MVRQGGVADIFAPVCSITTTKRRRFFWAAWWSAPPRKAPFQRPDASDGGAATFDEARAAAEARAGAPLTVIDPTWARAWIQILRGQAPRFPAPRGAEPRATAAPEASLWATLGVTRDVTIDELKLAYRKRALETHPDRGGSADEFRAVVAAYAEARRRLRVPRRKKG